ncbi:CpcT/CpeT family chromophore lyase [Shewanella algicola]
MTKDKIVSWDRGFDSNDQQVWGAVKGGYEFIKAQ